MATFSTSYWFSLFHIIEMTKEGKNRIKKMHLCQKLRKSDIYITRIFLDYKSQDL